MSSKTDTPKDETTEDTAPKPGGKKKLILMAAPVLLIALGAGLWFSGILPGLLGMKHDEHHEAEAGKPAIPVFVDLPDMIANLAGPSSKPSYIKLQARLEVSRQEDVEKIKLAMPRLQDMFQTYLREMRPEELRNSIGTYRLREELLGRANVAVAPVKVHDVLFTQLLIQ
ncbi:MAG: flagellar basal body protein FliL [Acetobacteraceae bacterium]|nr:flagellar basal body protein FliL [Acetobacteraceae bacterium]